MVGSNTTLGSHATIWTRPERGLLQRGASKEKAKRQQTPFLVASNIWLEEIKILWGCLKIQDPQKTIGDLYGLFMGIWRIP